MAIWALPNVVQIRGDKSIRSREIRASDLQRSEHYRSRRRAEVSHWEMDLPFPAQLDCWANEKYRIWRAKFSCSAKHTYVELIIFAATSFVYPISSSKESYMGATQIPWQHVTAVNIQYQLFTAVNNWYYILLTTRFWKTVNIHITLLSEYINVVHVTIDIF